MRQALAKYAGQRVTLEARVELYSARRIRGKALLPTVLLRAVQAVGGAVLTDHLWIENARPFVQGGIAVGARVRFTTRVKVYHKYTGKRWIPDYGIEVPTRIERLAERDEA